jgi:penicillin-binding protein 1A
MRRSRALAAGVIALAFLAEACSLPDLDDYRANRQPLAQTSFLFSADGTLLRELHAEQDRVVLGYLEIPASIKDAVVAVEDQRFWDHYGVDLRAIIRAAYVDVTTGEIVEGGSTITQQLVKNWYVGSAETFRRKIDEAALALQLEEELSKEQILTQYLNTVYFGRGAYGVQAAAKAFFGVDAQLLTLAQAALLAGQIAAPTRYDPFEYPGRALRRRNRVLAEMLELGMIDRTAYRNAARSRIELDPARSRQRYPAPYFVDYTFRWFLTTTALPKETFGKPCPPDRYPYRDWCPARWEIWYEGGLQIHTTLDLGLQEKAEQAVNGILSFPGDPYGALSAVDPRTGYVRAMVGGRSWFREGRFSKLNLATGGKTGRQAGSAFKVFALVAALENGISPDSRFSAPSSITIPQEHGPPWHVTNAGGAGYGTLSLEQATVNSVNTVYAQLITRLGPETVVRTARRMGIRCCRRAAAPVSDLQALPAAVLGSNEVNTLEMASAVGTLAAGGERVAPTPIALIEDARGNTLWRADPEPKQVLDPRIASVANDILQQVVLSGTGTAANIGRPQIGKTGTEDENRDAWFVGAIPQLAVAVWVGFPEGQIPMEPPRTRITVYGGTWPAQIWWAFMVRATRNWPVRDFPSPDVSFVAVRVDVTQDPYCLPNEFTLPGNIQTLHFIEGLEPKKTCKEPSSAQTATVPSVIGLPQEEAEDVLRDAGFYVRVEVERSTQPDGTVIAQSPAAGTEALQTTTVTITVSKEVSDGGDGGGGGGGGPGGPGGPDG